MITIVDYGLGNIQAFVNVYKRLNIEATRARTADELKGATKVILPGVGAFDHAMEQLQSSGMRETLDDLAMNQRVPVLGICVGMQMLARGSEEGLRAGLGWIDGYVKRLPDIDVTETLPLPHMGWNDVQPTTSNGLFSELEREARFYFLHSYYFECERADDVAAVARYGRDFTCAVTSRNIHGVQFHPEKSHHFGRRLLQNFAAI